MPKANRSHKLQKLQSHVKREHDSDALSGYDSDDESTVASRDSESDDDADVSEYEDALSDHFAAHNGSFADDTSEYEDALSDIDVDSESDSTSDGSDSEYMDALTGLEDEVAQDNIASDESVDNIHESSLIHAEEQFEDDSGYEYDTDVTLVGEQNGEDHTVKSSSDVAARSNAAITGNRGTKG
nr:hypothetical protein B0A51_18312 [Rachicladosporium sp. CCFEE 5018]